MNNGKFGRFDLRVRSKLPLAFGLSCLAVLAWSYYTKQTPSVTSTFLVAVGGTTAFLYAQHTRDIQLFRELFREFNERYGKLNDSLNEIYNRQGSHSLSIADKGVLAAYFNLCAEEYMYANAGYIYVPVWDAWQNGMRYFDQDPEIHDFWKRELGQGSYYGFVLHCPYMPNGLKGPFPLDADTIDEHFQCTAPGNYAVGWVRKDKWSFDYVGRDDKNVNRRLKEHLAKGYSHFKAAYASSPKVAFERECEHFHDFLHRKNKIHPPLPDGTDWKCPRCLSESQSPVQPHKMMEAD
jgi:hypothetical protein